MFRAHVKLYVFGELSGEGNTPEEALSKVSNNLAYSLTYDAADMSVRYGEDTRVCGRIEKMGG
jgi:hypothetical protein